MRTVEIIKEALFAKKGEEFETVSLPHTWNNLDGQDGGGDYWRGEGVYKIFLPEHHDSKRQYIEFRGANHVAVVYCNGQKLGEHKGGFSTFRFELTDFMKDGENELTVVVSNEECDVYPQQADFTFFGGLYREVCFIEVENSHFDLMQTGTSGVFVTPHVSGKIRIDGFISNTENCQIRCRIKDREGKTVVEKTITAESHTISDLMIKTPVLWDGLKNPYCYTAELTLLKEGKETDQVRELFGIRSFHVNPDDGFYLNGVRTPLHGVARHQDRKNMGWAITHREHEEDIEIIKEIGANTLRLAHYQHDQYFYELCDKAGFIVWAEIPFITAFRPGKEAYENTLSQMTELIAQNYNHPAICFWGISNEISVTCESEELYRNLCDLQALCKRMDPSRLTTMAQVSMLSMESDHNDITDVLSYNHYFGWYMGDVSENGPWLDRFHKLYPDRCLGVSEYGAEANIALHSANPEGHDYSEEYQAYYHHEMLKIFEKRPYLWSTHVWNMFDFAADSRDEGGCKGRNNKGLVTYDRKTRKDSFYIYQAYWSEKPMVHICGRRFFDRTEDQRNILVFTNCSEVRLYVNGELAGTSKSKDHGVLFENVALKDGVNEISVRTEKENVSDTIQLNAVAVPNPAYSLPKEETEAGNWFDSIRTDEELEFKEGYFSIKDKIGEMLEQPEARAVVQELFDKASAKGGAGEDMQKSIEMCRNMALEPILTIMKAPKGTAAYLNNKLNKIKKQSDI